MDENRLVFQKALNTLAEDEHSHNQKENSFDSFRYSTSEFATTNKFHGIESVETHEGFKTAAGFNFTPTSNVVRKPTEKSFGDAYDSNQRSIINDINTPGK